LRQTNVSEVKLANGGIESPLRDISVNLKWGNKEKKITLLVLKNMPQPLILRTSWIAEMEAVVYQETGKICVNEKESEEFRNVVNGRPSDRPEIGMLRIGNPSIIPPCSVAYVANA
jgi:hypothetical protein